MTHSIITLLTDFGTKDHYVGAMRGVILGINPHATIVDIAHHISRQSIIEGAFLLSSVYPYFPQGTIHLAVVDPGVGSERKPILVKGENFFFIGPDNGIFGLIYDQLKKFSVYELTNAHFFLKPVSATFQGTGYLCARSCISFPGSFSFADGKRNKKFSKTIFTPANFGEKKDKG